MTGFTFLREIDGKRIEIQPTANRPDFFRSLAVSSQRFSSSVSEFLDRLPSFSTSTQSDDDRKISAAFELVCYRAAEYAEFFETAASHFPILRERRFKSQLSSYHSSIKSHFRNWNLICNRIKHNGNQLVHVRVQYSSGRVALGFSLISPVPPDSWGINHDLHSKGTRCMSYTRALNQLVFDICKADQLLRYLVSAIEESERHDPISTPGLSMLNTKVLERIEQLNHVGIIGDSSRIHIPTRNGDLLEWSASVLIPPNEQANVSAYYISDGVSRSFPII